VGSRIARFQPEHPGTLGAGGHGPGEQGERDEQQKSSSYVAKGAVHHWTRSFAAALGN
jgi:hypothetical protein